MSVGAKITHILNVLPKLTIVFIFLLFGSCVLLVHGASADIYTDAYSKTSNQLPDDSYTLYKNGSAVASSSDCGAVWGCTTGNYQFFDPTPNSHQYITLSNDSINQLSSKCSGTTTASSYCFGHIVELEIYSRTQTDKTIYITEVNRGLGDALACRNTIKLYYYNGNSNILAGAAHPVTPPPGATCPATYPAAAFPSTALEPVLNPDGTPTGTFRGKILIRYGDPSETGGTGSQTSFHVSTSSDAKFGYYGAGPNANSQSPILSNASDHPGEHGWANVYATNLASAQGPASTNDLGDHWGNKMRFYFRPQCQTAAGTQFNIEWDDVNVGDTTTVQQITPEAYLYKFIPGDPSSMQLYRTYSSLGDDTNHYQVRTAQYTEDYAAGKPYAYMMEFDNISGGNGISFRYPFDSADARLQCPSPPNNVAVTAACGYAGITAYIPPQSNGSATHYHVRVWHNNNNVDNNDLPDNLNGYIEVADSWGSGYLHFDWPPEQLNNNAGWTVAVFGNYAGETGLPTVKTTPWTGICYHASCQSSIQPIAGDDVPGVSNGVQAGKPFNVVVTMYGHGPADPLPASLRRDDGYVAPLSATIYNDPNFGTVAPNSVNQNVSNGGSVTFTFQLTAPANINNYTINPYADYWGLFAIDDGATNCSSTVAVYQPFTLTPHAIANPSPGSTNEDLTSFDYTTYVDNSYSGNVNATTTNSKVYKQPATIYASDARNTLGGGRTTTLAGSQNLGSAIVAGEEYCAYIQVPYTSAFIGPGSNVAGQTNNSLINPAEQCINVVNKPTFRAYGSGVAAGGGVGTCSGAGGLLAAWNNYDTSSGFNYGSGSQLSALALIKITGFASAQEVTSPTYNSPNMLSFANTTSSPATSTDSTDGGGWFGGSNCITDPTPDTTGSATSDLSAGALVSPDSHVGIDSTGDVYIGGDVLYQGNNGGATGLNASWSAPKDIPSVVVHAKGNIYISQNVKELDGIYVAEGKIYTCASGPGTPVPATDLYSSCSNQLVVYGSLIGKQVNLMRTYGSLRDEKPALSANGTTHAPFSVYTTPAPTGYYCVQVQTASGGIRKRVCSTDGSLQRQGSDRTSATVYCARASTIENDLKTTDWICENQITTYGATAQNVGNSCSNNVSPTTNTAQTSVRVGTSPAGTCAAEVFDFSPEYFLSNGGVQPPSNGAQQFDSILSLPPVL